MSKRKASAEPTPEPTATTGGKVAVIFTADDIRFILEATASARWDGPIIEAAPLVHRVEAIHRALAEALKQLEAPR